MEVERGEAPMGLAGRSERRKSRARRRVLDNLIDGAVVLLAGVTLITEHRRRPAASSVSGTVFEGDGWRTVTVVLPCGAEVVATPDGCDIDPRTLGYPDEDPWELTKDHDPAHLWLCRTLGLPTSPTLERLVHEDASLASDDLVAREEAAVQAVLAFRRAAMSAAFDPPAVLDLLAKL